MFLSTKFKELAEDIKHIESLVEEFKSIKRDNDVLLKIIEQREKALEKISEEKSKGFPWLANAIADFYKYKDYEIAYYLENKSHPASAKAQEVRQVADEKRKLVRGFKELEYLVSMYESLFPWIKDYVDEDLDMLMQRLSEANSLTIDESEDPVSHYMISSEYKTLSIHDRNQLALDRYLSSRKSPHEIGRDYERYIGYLFEKEGYKVEYHGIQKGLEDLGRDLICTKGNKVEVIQCKNWAHYKVIHENHINQLYGTAVKYYIDHGHNVSKLGQLALFPDSVKSGYITARFVTSTSLSETALLFASALGVVVDQNKPLEKYPMIKCNISPRKEKIYHLPFDQQYDKVQINKAGEMYVYTVKEAEDNGFRRAYRWKGGICKLES